MVSLSRHFFHSLNKRFFSSLNQKSQLNLPTQYRGINFVDYSDKLDFIRQNGSFPLFRCILSGGKLAQNIEFPFSDTLSQQLLKKMMFTRICDNVFNDIQRQGRISFYLMSLGEEATSLGSSLSLDQQDIILSQYRELAALLWRGYSIDQILHQLFGSSLDISKGRNMPCHYTDKNLGIYPISSPVATQITHAAGVGYSFRLRHQPQCAVTYFGEGTASEGDFTSGINIAKTIGAQTIFICRNNSYAISTPVEEQYGGDGIATRGVAYGLPSIRVDGNDLIACYLATKMARQICLEEQSPVLIEMMTYRAGNHSTSDESSAYRSNEEVDFWKNTENCPISRFEQLLINRGIWSTEQSKNYRSSIRPEILKKIREVEKQKKLHIQNGLFQDVYDHLPIPLNEQAKELHTFISNYGQHYSLDHFEQ